MGRVVLLFECVGFREACEVRCYRVVGGILQVCVDAVSGRDVCWDGFGGGRYSYRSPSRGRLSAAGMT